LRRTRLTSLIECTVTVATTAASRPGARREALDWRGGAVRTRLAASAAGLAMHAAIAAHLTELAGLCRRYGVARLEVFGSAARGADFDPARSDADFLVTFGEDRTDAPLACFFGLAEALESLLGRKVDLVERGAIEASRNYIRRRRILADAEPVYG
jgi:predicted nucleotidyltransferase